MTLLRITLFLCMAAFAGALACGAEELPLIGYTKLRTNLPGGRHANVRTMRATVVQLDGSGRRPVAISLVDDPDAWTQFAGWSPDGGLAIVNRGWQKPENSEWEEQHRQFRMTAGNWQLDSCLLDLQSGHINNVTAVERVSHYNGGLFFLPNGEGLGFTPLIDGVSTPFVMDLDGHHKRDVSEDGAGFTYGFSVSPDGTQISYHDSYQVFIADADGSSRRQIQTGNPFNFVPRWSPDGEWLLFVSGVHERWNPYIVRCDGTDLQKIADLGGYQGWIAFLDIPDFHNGSSDLPVWSADGNSVFYTGRVEDNIELFQVTMDGVVTQLSRSASGTLHYHIKPSSDGRRLLYGSMRDGVRNLYIMDLADRSETQLTDLKAGYAAMWPYWQESQH